MKYLHAIFLIVTLSTQFSVAQLPNHEQWATHYFNTDSKWYLSNIPFFECSDKEIQDVYYYRWKLYKAHIRNVGQNAYIITEFIDHVSWDRDPYCTINAASMHHILEGRWIKDDRYLDGYISNLYEHGGNNRKYSESIADASYARYLVNGDTTFIRSHLNSMISVYNAWDDHYDKDKGLYFIPAMPDATEYNIAAIDASGGKDGFEGGDAFRPTINSYQYGNALAISKIAKIGNDSNLVKTFEEKATLLKRRIQDSLWNKKMSHFVDRYKISNNHVKYWDFIRGRELAGYAPWYFNIPEDKPEFHGAWEHLKDTTRLLGAFGYRTNEPSYEYYFHQFLYHEGKRGSQWNGPSWPYQTSQALTGMARFIQHYKQHMLTKSDYLKALRLYTKQHYLPNGNINLVENYDPNLGGPIVFFNWSNHYLHSSYNNLIISGLCGLIPSEGNYLLINPLVDTSITYFYLGNIFYHGHEIKIYYDQTGDHYKKGKGITVFVDDKKQENLLQDQMIKIDVGSTILQEPESEPLNFALNIHKKGFPKVKASVNNDSLHVHQVNDGRVWYFTEIDNKWTTQGSDKNSDWISFEFDEEKKISSIVLNTYVDDLNYKLPKNINIYVLKNKRWEKIKQVSGIDLIKNTSNMITLTPTFGSSVKLIIEHPKSQIAFTEISVY